MSAPIHSSFNSAAFSAKVERRANVEKVGVYYRPQTALGSQTLGRVHAQVTDPTSHTKFQVNARLQCDHIQGLRFLRERQNITGDSPTQEQAFARYKRSDAAKKAYYSNDNLIFNRKMIKADEQRSVGKVTLALAKWAKGLSSAGDWFCAICTTAVEGSIRFLKVTQDSNSLTHRIARVLFGGIALSIIGIWTLNKLALSLISPSSVGVDANDFFGWYWITSLTHLPSLIAQGVLKLCKSTSGDLSDAAAQHAQAMQQRIINGLWDMKVHFEQPENRQQLDVFAQGLNKTLFDGQPSKRLPRVAQLIMNSRNKAELERNLANYLGEPNTTERIKVSREKEVLTILRLIENHQSMGRLHEGGDMAVRTWIEDKFCAKATDQVDLTFEKACRKLHEATGWKFAKKAADVLDKRVNYIKNQKAKASAKNTFDWQRAHACHTQSILNNPDAPGWIKGLVTCSERIHTFGRMYVLSLDTNLSRIVRYCIKGITEFIGGGHASQQACHTAGHLIGWSVVNGGIAAASMGLGMATGFTPSISLNPDGVAPSVSGMGLTSFYIVFAGISLIPMALAKAAMWAHLGGRSSLA